MRMKKERETKWRKKRTKLTRCNHMKTYNGNKANNLDGQPNDRTIIIGTVYTMECEVTRERMNNYQ